MTGPRLFDGIGAATRRDLDARALVRRYARGEVLFTAGSEARGLFVILDGRVRVSRGGRGRPHVVHEEGPGGTLGEVPLFDGGGYPATAVAREPTRCLLYTPRAVAAAMAADPAVGWAIARALARRVRELVERLDGFAARDVTARVAAAVRERHRAAGGAAFTLGQTHEQLAEELWTVREVVVRSLRALRRRGVLATAGRGRYRVADARALDIAAGT
ncbi:MAG TPA: Crp/Fnr family transcriptional regulator [Gemmatimonadales bacterium]|nr:Crp/Fnr family transcriptional regulator [Gemmatimonadales bacterium]